MLFSVLGTKYVRGIKYLIPNTLYLVPDILQTSLANGALTVLYKGLVACAGAAHAAAHHYPFRNTDIMTPTLINPRKSNK